MKTKKLLYLILEIVIFLFALGNHSNANETISVSTWNELANVIETGNNTTIKLTNDMEANSTITIPKGKNITLAADKSTTILRYISFKDAFFVNNGTLTINGKDAENKIVFDGNGFQKDNTGKFITDETGNKIDKVEAINRIIEVSSGGKLHLENIVMQNNKITGTKNGGALAILTNGEATLNNVNIDNNECIGGSQGGGGIYCNGKLTIYNSEISNNYSDNNGGGINGKEIILYNTTIKNNTTTKGGGGIYVSTNCKVEINNSSIEGNIAKTGGGIYWYKATLIINGNNWKISEQTKNSNALGDYSELQILEDNNIKNNVANANETKNITKGDYAGNDVYPYDWCTALEYETIDESNFKRIGKMNNKYKYINDGEEKNLAFIQQGMAANDDYILLGRIHKKRNENGDLVDGEGLLTLISRELLKTKGSLEEAIIDNYVDNNKMMGHLNNLTYNEDTGKFYTANGKKLYEITIKEEKITINDFINLDISLGGLTYYSDGKYFIGKSGTALYKIPINITEDENGEKHLEISGTSEKISDEYITLTHQDLEDYGENLYYCCFEYNNPAWQTKYYESSDARHVDSLVYVYDLEGVLQKVLYIPKTLLYKSWGELEDVYIDKATGEMIFAFSSKEEKTWDSISLYSCNYLQSEEDKEYNITYELNEGTNNSDNPSKYTQEDTITLKDASKEGYTFEGWYENADFTGNKVTKIENRTGDITLYAKFTTVAYTIRYNLEGGELPKGKTNQTAYTIETESFTLNNPEKEGYEFKGWTGSNGNTPELTVTIEKGSTGNREYTAKWKKIIEKLQVTIDEKYKEKEDDKTHISYLSKIETNTTIKALKEKINTNASKIEIIDNKGNKLGEYEKAENGTYEWKGEKDTTENEENIGTGYQIKISLNGEIVNYTLVVTGDLNGNGKVDQGDILMLAKYNVGKLKEDTEDETQRITKESILASDLNSNGSNSDQGDLLMIAKILVGKFVN